jgi:hypothetical protein
MHLPTLQVAPKLLPRSEGASAAVYLAPRNHLERAVQTVWMDTLHKTEPISMAANFFEVHLSWHGLMTLLLVSSLQMPPCA